MKLTKYVHHLLTIKEKNCYNRKEIVIIEKDYNNFKKL